MDPQIHNIDSESTNESTPNNLSNKSNEDKTETKPETKNDASKLPSEKTISSVKSSVKDSNDSLIYLSKSKSNIINLSSGLQEILKNIEKNKEDNLNLTSEQKIELIRKEVQIQNFPLIDPDRINKFEFLGKGTYGNVFRAEFHKNGKVDKIEDIALKELQVDKVFKDILKLLQEINMSIMSYHPFVPRFHGVYFNEYVCLIFDLVKGKSLKQVAEERYKDNFKLKLNALVKLVKIINDLHNELNIIHRDLKPDNIIVNEADEVFLIDFGTSKVISNGDSTHTYDAKGTTLYMGPENFQFDLGEDNQDEENEKKDERPITITVAFDVWSLGCIISEICSGIQPWKNYKKPNINETIIMKLLSEGKPFPIPVQLPNNLKELLSECFMINPDERIKTSDLLKRLTEIMDSL